jgi:hypothetical protein
MDDAELAIYKQCTGRTTAPTTQATESWCIAGRRGGKSRVMATVAAWLACFSDLRPHLGPGETATIMLIAANRKQARTALRYLRSLIVDHPVLARLVIKETGEQIELSNRCVIEITTASFRTSRGYTVAAVICDELAFWIDDSDAANPAAEIIASLRPGMATIPGAMLMTATSPYSRRGIVWETYRRHWAKDGDPILVWTAPTLTMNPTVDKRVIDEAYVADPSNAEAEYGAQFRSDIAAFVDREVVMAAVPAGCREIPPVAGVIYSAFVDPSGGSLDSFGLAVAHRDGNDRGILDVVREIRPPFSPDSAVAELAQTLKAYGVAEVVGDRWGGEWPREAFRTHGIEYAPSERPKSAIYQEFLPIVNSGRCELLDHPRMLGQLCALERRTARGGRDSIDHPPGLHDDIANCAAGAIVAVAGVEDPLSMWVRLNR